MNWKSMTALGLGSAVLSYLAVLAFKEWATRRNWVDRPNERSSHVRPTPRGGGIVIVGMSLIGLLLSARTGSWAALGGYLVAALLVAAISWVDDLRKVPAGVRFGVHIAAAAILLWGTGTYSDISLPGDARLSLGLWGIPLFVIWIVGLTNAYNFMDGIDGIAAGQAVIAALGWSLVAWIGPPGLLLPFAAVLAGTAFGFLLHNWSPAAVFMGDVGSAFLGFTFAALPLLARSSGSSPANDLMPLLAVLFVWPFVFDSFFTFVRRLRKREPVFSAHRSHLYQRLVIAGHPHATVSLLYLGLAAVGVGIGLVWIRWGLSSPLLAIPLLALGLWKFTERVERRRSLLAADLKPVPPEAALAGPAPRNDLGRGTPLPSEARRDSQ